MFWCVGYLLSAVCICISLGQGSKAIINKLYISKVFSLTRITDDNHLVLTNMEFITEATEYNVADFLEKFGASLPKIVMVTDGFCGDVVEDIFSRGQILIIQTESHQRRVVAKSGSGKETQLFSIPVDYQANLFSVNDRGKVGTPLPLSHILKNRRLPITVQFPKDSTVTINDQTKNNYFPALELIKVFDQVYILGNSIVNGQVCEDVVHVPLYLTDLKLSIVEGIKGQKREQWFTFMKMADRACQMCEYDQEFGNINIAVYNPDAVHSNSVYTYVEPTLYANFRSLFDNPSKSVPDERFQTDPGNNVYAEIGDSPDQVTSIDQLQNQLMDVVNKKKKVELGKPKLKPPPVSTKPLRTQNTHGNENAGTLPPLPARNAAKTVQNKPVSSNVYVNNLPTGTIPPIPKRLSELDSKTDVSASNEPLQQLPDKEVKEEPDSLAKPTQIGGTAVGSSVTNPADVAKLTIPEVVEYMKHLKLEKYVDIFQEQLIDGDMLIDLNKDILKYDFGFTNVEAMRLMKFAKTGHVPV